MQHPDEGTIHAWIDGALTVDEAASLESHAAQCDQCSAAIAEARGLVAASSRILLALDDVPAGVIPLPVPKPRAWYARNEFRAAAAVLLVASASLVAVRGGRELSSPMNDIASVSMDTSALVAAEPSASVAAPEARTMSAAPAQATENSEAGAVDAAGPVTRGMTAASGMGGQSGAEKAGQSRNMDSRLRGNDERMDSRVRGHDERVDSRVRGNDERMDSRVRGNDGRTSAGEPRVDAALGAAAGANSGPVVAAPMARDRMTVTNEADFSGKGVRGGSAAGIDSERTRRIGSSQPALEQVVVTGVASEVPRAPRADAAPLKIVRADTSQRVRTIVYEVSKGVEVTLTQTEPTSFDQLRALQGRSADAAVQAPSAPLPAPPALATVPAVAGSAMTVMKAVPINSISWADSVTGRGFILSGALSRGELEALKVRIAAQREHGFPPSRE